MNRFAKILFVHAILIGGAFNSKAQIFNQLQLDLNAGSTLDNNDDYSHQNIGMMSATTNFSKRLYCGINAGMATSRQGNNIAKGLKLFGVNVNYHYAVSPRSRIEFNNSLQINNYKHERTTDLIALQRSAFLFIRPTLAVQPFNHYGRCTVNIGINFGVPVWPDFKNTAWLNYGAIGVGFLIGEQEVVNN
jgi:hypothetical protein